MHFPISVLLICGIDKDNILISCLYQYYPTAEGISTNEFLSHFNHKNTLLTGCPVKRVHINVFIGAGFLKRGTYCPFVTLFEYFYPVCGVNVLTGFYPILVNRAFFIEYTNSG